MKKKNIENLYIEGLKKYASKGLFKEKKNEKESKARFKGSKEKEKRKPKWLIWTENCHSKFIRFLFYFFLK